jgi:hypothetical protein
MQPFIGIVLATFGRPRLIREFLVNLEQTAADSRNFEVLIRADEGDEPTIRVIEEFRETASFRIVLLVEKNSTGTFQLHKAYSLLTFRYASASTYFFWNLTDEIRFLSKGWDEELKGYIGHFSDGIFRLKVSQNRANTYSRFRDVLTTPDNYPVITRRWLQLVGGWGDYWGTDSWHESIDYFLSRSDSNIARSLVCDEVEMSGQTAGLNLENSNSSRRAKMIEQSYRILSSFEARENFSRLSQRLRAGIHASRAGLTSYQIGEDEVAKVVVLLSADGRDRLAEFPYGLAPGVRDLLFEKIFSGLELLLGEKNSYVMRNIWLGPFLDSSTYKRWIRGFLTTFFDARHVDAFSRLAIRYVRVLKPRSSADRNERAESLSRAPSEKLNCFHVQDCAEGAFESRSNTVAARIDQLAF